MRVTKQSVGQRKSGTQQPGRERWLECLLFVVGYGECSDSYQREGEEGGGGEGGGGGGGGVDEGQRDNFTVPLRVAQTGQDE